MNDNDRPDDFEEPIVAESVVGFHISDNGEFQAAVEELDRFVNHLCHQDHLARQSSISGDVETAQNVSMAVTQAVTGIPWGHIPTVIMHCVARINSARQDGGRAVEVAKKSGEGLKVIAAGLSQYGLPVHVCMEILDLAQALISVYEEFPYEKVED